MRIAHLINPVRIGPSSDLHRAQPVTFASMLEARDFATAGGLQVDLLAVGYPEDQGLVPAGFRELPPLARSVLDVGTFRKPRKLPLLADLVDALAGTTQADALVYTNVDIAVQPNFYRVVGLLLQQGFDAAIVNRRTIPETTLAVADQAGPGTLGLWGSAQAGIAHKGYDCFIFSRTLAGRLTFGHTCIGIRYVGKTFAVNLHQSAARFGFFPELNITFHLGNSQVWKNPDYSDYAEHNMRALRETMVHYGIDDARIDADPFLQRLRLPRNTAAEGPWRRLWRRYAQQAQG